MRAHASHPGNAARLYLGQESPTIPAATFSPASACCWAVAAKATGCLLQLCVHCAQMTHNGRKAGLEAEAFIVDRVDPGGSPSGQRARDQFSSSSPCSLDAGSFSFDAACFCFGLGRVMKAVAAATVSRIM